ncbi:MAG: hypothetical protein EOO41_01380, partial [Methanobacteriota archaeon]
MKYENLALYKCLFGEFLFVFCGDSGQGDAAVASLALHHAPPAHGAVASNFSAMSQLHAAFIH